MLLYHLDRGHSLKEGMQINLKNGSQALSNVENSPFISLFTDGFSFFGLDILCSTCPMIPTFFDRSGDSPFINVGNLFKIKGQVDIKLIEFIFELVRRLYFSHYPSRFQSLFAVDSVKEFHRWPELLEGKAKTFSLIDYDVYEISVSDNIPAFDSSWLRGGIAAGIDKGLFFYGVKIDSLFDVAYHYWNKDFTEEPRLEYLVKLPIRVGRKVIP